MENSKCRLECPKPCSAWGKWLAAGFHARNRWRLYHLMPACLLAAGVQANAVQWSPRAPRAEIRPEFEQLSGVSGSNASLLSIRTGDHRGYKGWWETVQPVEGGRHYRFDARLQTKNIPFPRRSAFCRIIWLSENGEPVLRDAPVIGPYHPAGEPDTAKPELPRETRTEKRDTLRYSAVYRAPSRAAQARIELHLQWAVNATAVWSQIVLMPTSRPPDRKVRLASIHLRPDGKSPEANRQQFAPRIAGAARQGANLIVLPETLTYYGVGMTYAECAEAVPGPSTAYFGDLAKKHRVHLVVGLLERDAETIYNVAVLLGPAGEYLGKYRKVCLPRGEVEGGITAGTSYPVFKTSLGRIGMMVCYDGFFPEVARRLTEGGAEIIAFPVWGCNPLLAAARACENHVFVVSSTYTDASQDWMITGVYGHDGSVLAQATEWNSIAIAEVDLAARTVWAGMGDFSAEVHRNRPPSALEYSRAGIAPEITPASDFVESSEPGHSTIRPKH